MKHMEINAYFRQLEVMSLEEEEMGGGVGQLLGVGIKNKNTPIGRGERNEWNSTHLDCRKILKTVLISVSTSLTVLLGGTNT